MTIITKVGASYNDHTNDDTPEVDSFSHGCYHALFPPQFVRREPGTEAKDSLALFPGPGTEAKDSIE